MNTEEKIEQRRKEAAKAQKRNKRRATTFLNDLFFKRVLAVVICLLIVAGIAALVIPKMGWSRRVVTAVEIGNEKISAAEYTYYYRMAYSSYYQTLVNYLGEDNVPIDTSVSLKDQQMSTDMTYADYFSNSAITTLTRLVAVEKAAEEAGFELPESYQEQFDSTMATVESYAKAYDMTLNDYLSANYGFGFNQKLLEKCLTRELLVTAYEESVEDSLVYTDEQLEEYYEENKTDYETADFRIVQFASQDADEEAGTEEVTVEQAKANAEAFMEGITTEDEFEAAAHEKLQAEADEGEEVEADKSLMTDVEYSTASALDANVCSYIFDEEHQAGDMDLIESASGENYYVIWMVNPAHRDETPVVNVRHILVGVDDTTDQDELDDAKFEMDQIVEEYLDGDRTEESFAELAEEYSDDSGSNTNGGLYENVEPGQMVTEFNDWIFDPERQVGDTDVILTTYGYHFMYFCGTGDATWKVQVSEDRKDADFDDWETGITSQYEAVTRKLGVSLRDEPID